MKTLVIEYAREQDGRRYALDIVREDLSGLGLPSRREEWCIIARNDQEAHHTVEYHFGHSALWYKLARASSPVSSAGDER